MTVAVVLVPSDPTLPLRTIRVGWDDSRRNDDDRISASIRSLLQSPDHVETPLLRPLGESPGLFAYHHHGREYSGLVPPTSSPPSSENVRATRLAMACGLMAVRFHGPVLLARSHTVFVAGRRWEDLTADDVRWPCEVSPDLRRCVADAVGGGGQPLDGEDTAAVGKGAAPPPAAAPVVPAWLANAAQQNYHDAAAVARMTDAMKPERRGASNDGDSDDDSDGEDDSDSDDSPSDESSHRNDDAATYRQDKERPPGPSSRPAPSSEGFVAKSPLCLFCRRPTTSLCPGCGGAYFCPPPRRCFRDGWSHSCQCSTWAWYCSHRGTLSAFPYLDPAWQAPLVGRDFQLSEDPYRDFLSSVIGIPMSTSPVGPSSQQDGSIHPVPAGDSWWRTETDGWAGGESPSARLVDISKRRTYRQGFAPLPPDQLPPQRRCTDEDFAAGVPVLRRNAVGLYELASWEDYYRVRKIPPESPVALLCTFPLTVYHAIVKYGEVPVTVSLMLKRPLRVHVVGAEKEVHFLDLFLEVAYLLPDDVKVRRCVALLPAFSVTLSLLQPQKVSSLTRTAVLFNNCFPHAFFITPLFMMMFMMMICYILLKVELVFVVRGDMVPSRCKDLPGGGGGNGRDRSLLRVELATNLTVAVVAGTYGGDGRSDPSLDPNFDVGSGPPDMVVALNAGLHAYESWRDVVGYLHSQTAVVGVFTDYNEYSGMSCAALGGADSRESLAVNPFRQPRAMPVFSMNLPQFSNGFLYVFNEQRLD
jgi:hypothetical protein